MFDRDTTQVSSSQLETNRKQGETSKLKMKNDAYGLNSSNFNFKKAKMKQTLHYDK